VARRPAAIPGHRVVVFLQENMTTDFYFAAMAAWGARVAVGKTLLSAGPDHDQPHDRNSWVHSRMGDYKPLAAQVDTDAVIPFYSYLAKQFTFSDHHFGPGTNSTPGHLLAIGGQTPTFRNPPFSGPYPTWNLPSIFSVAQAAGVDWAAFPDSGYPTKYYTSMSTPEAVKRTHAQADFLTMAKAGTLPPVSYVWSPQGSDEHPPSKSDPQYIRRGHDLIWQRVSAVIEGGGWANTTFILTWDDWGGYADSVTTPNIETLPDALHPNGFQAIGGSRIPLVMFGGKVAQGIDPKWHSHASIPKTIIDLLGLPPMGVPRVDAAPSLAARVDPALNRQAPPLFGQSIVQPPNPVPKPKPARTTAWRKPLGVPMPALVTLDGSTVPAPTDGVVKTAPPKPVTLSVPGAEAVSSASGAAPLAAALASPPDANQVRPETW